MKKILYFACLLTAVLTSCSKDDIESTATVDMAGQWYVRADVIYDGEVYTDLYGYGQFLLLTYNTADNTPDEMWVTDNGNFWTFKVKAPINQKTLTFATNGVVENQISGYGIGVKITNGKILPKAGLQKNGAPADSITLDVEFEDDEDGYIYRFQGVRYSGLKEND